MLDRNVHPKTIVKLGGGGGGGGGLLEVRLRRNVVHLNTFSR